MTAIMMHLYSLLFALLSVSCTLQSPVDTNLQRGTPKSLAELVKSRPSNKIKDEDKLRQYSKQFSQHAKIQKINIKDLKSSVAVAQEFVNLHNQELHGNNNNESRRNTLWTLSLKQHLRDNKVKEELIKEIVQYHRNDRGRKASQKYKLNAIDKDFVAFRNSRSLTSKKQRERRKGLKSLTLDQPLDFHLHNIVQTKVPYSEVVDKAVEFKDCYSGPRSAAWALRTYLTNQGYSEEEIKMAVVERAEKVDALLIAEEESRLKRVTSPSSNVAQSSKESQGVNSKRLPEKWWDTSNL